MKVWTFKTSPRMLFGLIMVITGVLVVFITFFANHVAGTKSMSASVSCKTEDQRAEFLTGLGWELGAVEEKQLKIPEEWNKVYQDYNEIQLSQGFDLTELKGQTVTLYTYEITNYEGIGDGIVADLLVFEGKLVGGDICYTSAEDGFLHGLEKKE